MRYSEAARARSRGRRRARQRLVLIIVEKKGLLRGKVAGVDSTYPRADASTKPTVCEDTEQSYRQYLKKLCQEQGIDNPTVEDCRRVGRKPLWPMVIGISERTSADQGESSRSRSTHRGASSSVSGSGTAWR